VPSAPPDDPEARKGTGKEAKLSFGGHVLMENRHGLCIDLCVASATETTEPTAASDLLRRQARRGMQPTTVGGDKGYHTTAFVR
jgi:hypothetical protein